MCVLEARAKKRPATGYECTVLGIGGEQETGGQWGGTGNFLGFGWKNENSWAKTPQNEVFVGGSQGGGGHFPSHAWKQTFACMPQ